VNSWPTIIELMSIHKRLKAFESILDGGDGNVAGGDMQHNLGAGQESIPG